MNRTSSNPEISDAIYAEVSANFGYLTSDPSWKERKLKQMARDIIEGEPGRPAAGKVQQMVRDALDTYIKDKSGDVEIRMRVAKEGPGFLEESSGKSVSPKGSLEKDPDLLEGQVFRVFGTYLHVRAAGARGTRTYNVSLVNKKYSGVFRQGDSVTIRPIGKRDGVEKPEAEIVTG